MKKYIVTSIEGGIAGGSKAKRDIIKFLSEEGFESILANPYGSKLHKFVDITKVLKNIVIEAGDIVVVQYPIPSQLYMDKILDKVLKKNAKLLLWIHDIPSLQNVEMNGHKLQEELVVLKKCSGMVVHNAVMKNWLISKGIKSPLVSLDVFDYDNPQAIQDNIIYDKSICFAGNLFKSEFLKKISLKNTLSVFGPNMFEKYDKCIQYNGQYSPEELPKYLTQNFGLIWDGADIETCSGTYGQYMKFNNPHKTSLYLSTGLPIIIWQEAAMAKFIVDNGLGITVSSLRDLDNIIDNLDAESFLTMKMNVMEVSKKLREGYFSKKAIQELCRIL